MKKFLSCLGFLMFFSSVIFGQEVDESQHQAQALYSEGVKFLQSNQYEAAEEKFTAALKLWEIKEAIKMSHVYRAFCFNGLQRYDDALQDFNQAIELFPEDPKTYIDRAKTYLYLKEPEKAIDDYNKVLDLDDDGEPSEAAYYWLGKVAYNLGEFEQSIGHMSELIRLVPTDAEAYFIRGTAKSNILDTEGAIADFDKAIEHNPNYMEAYANRGVQKLNAIPVEKKVGKRLKCLEEPCADLLKAKRMGDTTIDDLVYTYCKLCNFEKKE